MLKKLHRLCLSSLLVGGLCSSSNVLAESMTEDAGAGITPIEADRAAAIAREYTGGRVLDVRPLADESGRSYAVRLLLDPGRVRTVLVDGNSGQLH